MTCPVCEKRALEEKKAASDCKQEVKQLEAKSARLTIILTALGTLVGKELLDEAIALTDSIPLLGAAPSVEQDVVYADPDQPEGTDEYKKPNKWATVSHSVPSITATPTYFANVPALTPRLYAPTYEPQQLLDLSFADQGLVPENGYPLLILGGIKYMQGRKR